MKKLYDEIMYNLPKELLARVDGCENNGGHISPNRETQMCDYCHYPLALSPGNKGVEENLIRAAGLYALEKVRGEISHY